MKGFLTTARAILMFALILTLPAPLAAGAWMREKGTGFYSITTKMTATLETIQSGFLEYGMTDRLTFGASVDMTMQNGYAVKGTGHVFMRKPLGWTYGKGIWAWELGLGARITETARIPIAKTSLHYGRGIKMLKKSGWLTLDSGIEWDLGANDHIFKFDATVGLNISPRSKAMLQVFSNFTQYDATFTLAPSYIFSPRDKKISYVIGFEAQSDSKDALGIKIGIWQKF